MAEPPPRRWHVLRPEEEAARAAAELPIRVPLVGAVNDRVRILAPEEVAAGRAADEAWLAGALAEEDRARQERQARRRALREGFFARAPAAAARERPLQILTDANNVGYIDVPVDYKDGITLSEFEDNDPVIEIIIPNRGRVHKYFYNPESIEGWFRQQIRSRMPNFTIPEGNQIIATVDDIMPEPGIVINRGFVRISNPLNSINNSLFNGGRRRKTRRARRSKRSRKVNRY